MNTYSTTIHIRCPFQPVWDYYRLKVTSEQMIQCELLEEICNFVRGKTITQEVVADSIAEILSFEGVEFSLTLSGWHGANCNVVCKRSN